MKNYEQVMKRIEGGDIAPVYILHGTEPYFIDKIEQTIESKVLMPGMEAFNKVIFYGRDASASDILDQVRRLPMMAERQLVILREAQSMRTMGALAPVLQQPVETTVFIISHKHKKIDKRKAPFNKFAKSVVAAEMSELYENQVGTWLNKLLKEHQMTFTPSASQMLISHLGRSLSKYVNAVDKVKSYQPEGKVGVEVISDVIGVNRDYNIFELTEAIGLRDRKKTLHITEVLLQDMSKHPMVMLVGSIFTYVAKLYAIRPYLQDLDTVKRVISNHSPFIIKKYTAAAQGYQMEQLMRMMDLLKTYDLKSKGIESPAVAHEDLFHEMMTRLVAEY